MTDYTGDYRAIYSGRIIALEQAYPSAHERLIQWGRWNRGRDLLPDLQSPSVWRLPGEYDPDLDPDAVPEPPKLPVDEKTAGEIADQVCKPAFPAIWRRILKAHYIVECPHYDRPRKAKCGAEHYLEQLSQVLNYFQKGIDKHLSGDYKEDDAGELRPQESHRRLA